MTTAIKKKSRHKKPDAAATEKAARFTGGEPPEKKELFGKKEVHAPAEQGSLAGDGVLKKTPPLEVCEAAEKYLDKKTRLATAKDEAGRAAENLLGLLHKHKMGSVQVSDQVGGSKTLTVKHGDDKIQVEDSSPRMEMTE